MAVCVGDVEGIKGKLVTRHERRNVAIVELSKVEPVVASFTLQAKWSVAGLNA